MRQLSRSAAWSDFVRVNFEKLFGVKGCVLFPGAADGCRQCCTQQAPGAGGVLPAVKPSSPPTTVTAQRIPILTLILVAFITPALQSSGQEVDLVWGV